VPYERYEYTRLSQIREQMDLHRSYRKEDMLDDDQDDDDDVIRTKNAETAAED